MSTHDHTAWRYSDGVSPGCAGCRRAFNEYMQELRRRRADQRVLIGGRLTATRPSLPHGSASTYSNHVCRCPACTTAHARARRDRYRRNGR